MEPTELPGIFPEDTWLVLLSAMPAHIGIMCSMTTSYLSKTFASKKSFWDLMWLKSGFKLPKEYSSLSSKQKFTNINNLMKVDASQTTAMTVDRARMSELELAASPHGSSLIVTTHVEDIPYGYHGSSVLYGNVWDVSDFPHTGNPTSVELGRDWGAVDSNPLFLFGKRFLGQLKHNQVVDFLDVETLASTEPVDFSPPGNSSLSSFSISPNMNADYPWALVTGDKGNKTCLWIVDVQNRRYTSDNPIKVSANSEAISISFYGRWIAVVMSRDRLLQLWKLDANGVPPQKPQLTASLAKFPCSLQRTKLQFAVSLHQLVMFYVRQGKNEHARLLTVPIDVGFADKFQNMLDEAEMNSIVFSSVDPDQTSTLFVTATSGFIFASIQQDLFVINTFSKKTMMVLRMPSSIMATARAVDSALFVIASQSSLVAVDLLQRETEYTASSNRVAFYSVFIDAKKKVRVEESICRGSKLIEVLQRALPQDNNHGVIKHHSLVDPATPHSKQQTLMMLTRAPTGYPAAPGISIVDRTWSALNQVAKQYADPPIQIMSVEEHLEETQLDVQLDRICKSSTWVNSGKPIPDAVLIRNTADGIPWSLEKATKSAEALVASGIIKPNQ
eukprot:TRINITY_DN10483_c0_g1_i1.p1 TRINITY_DN10483_c0_g1~~TRINITY_DN10483_c0_g1_i1.p1  ORF type:complete len:616 (-),score=72.85 TRINITY_DN10483_c0_g1_i1:18-1865(-)